MKQLKFSFIITIKNAKRVFGYKNWRQNVKNRFIK